MQMKTGLLLRPSERDHTYFALPSRPKVRSVSGMILFSVSHSCKPLISSDRRQLRREVGQRIRCNAGRASRPVADGNQKDVLSFK